MKKFEYKIVSIKRNAMTQAVDLDETETQLTGEGLVGWEVISSFDSNDGSYHTTLCFLMKREIIKE